MANRDSTKKVRKTLTTDDLKTKTARKNKDIIPHREPYWIKLPGELVKGASMGFRRSPDSGAETWHARVYVDGEYRKTNLSSVTDQFQYREAYNAALEWAQYQKTAAPVAVRDYTLEEVVDEYLRELQGNSSRRLMDKRRQAAKRLNALITPAMNRKKVSKFSKPDITALQRRYSQRHSMKGELISADSVNRVMSHLIAALNHAHREGIVSDNAAWGTYRRLEEADVKRKEQVYVLPADRQAFLDAAEGPLKDICTALNVMAARPIELRRMPCKDVDLDNPDPNKRGVWLTSYKGNMSRGRMRLFALPEGSDIRALFRRLTADKRPGDPVFLSEKGKAWGQANLAKHHKKLIKDHGLNPDIESYNWRHCRITDWCDATPSIPITEIAKVAGTSVLYIEQNYYKSQADTRDRLAVL